MYRGQSELQSGDFLLAHKGHEEQWDDDGRVMIKFTCRI